MHGLPPFYSNPMIKRLFDIVFSLLIVFFTLPLIILILSWFIFVDKKPILFTQVRVGQYGSLFNMYKFRTMVEGAEKMKEGLFSYNDDTRITAFGHFLRKYSLDELPQLLNVLKGDMSIVGPRPCVCYELGVFENYPFILRKRFKLKPGITGLAQVVGRNSFDWDQKLYYDNIYIDKYYAFGIVADFFILLKSIVAVLLPYKIVESKPCSAPGIITKMSLEASVTDFL